VAQNTGGKEGGRKEGTRGKEREVERDKVISPYGLYTHVAMVKHCPH